MYFLDSDTLTLYLNGHSRVVSTVDQYAERVYLSSITLEEMIGLQIGQINFQRSKPKIGIGSVSQFFIELLIRLREFPLIAYSDEAENIFRRYSAATKRIGAMDCRLAAHASSLGFVVVTRNLADFERIPGADIEDWSGGADDFLYD